MTLIKRAAHLQGLLEGMKLDETKPENKAICEMLDILVEVTEEIQRLSTENAILKNMLSTCSHNDLCTHEHDLSLDFNEDEIDIDDIDDEDYQIICPTCDEIMFLNAETLEKGSINCKNCGELLEFDLSDLDEEDL